MLVELTTDNLEDVLNENEKTLVMYGAGWCGNCKLLKPKVKKLSNEYENINFIYVDAEKNPNSRNLTEISNLPTITAFKGKEVVGQDMGNKIEVVQNVIKGLL